MWKIWLAAAIAGIVAVITVLMGVIHQTRFTVILYRAVISIFLFGGGTYIIGVLYERCLLPYLMSKSVVLEKEPSIQQEDHADETVGDDLNVDEEKLKAEFSPFTADNLNRVSPPNS